MQPLIDFLRALQGLGRLFRFDQGYRNFFDTTIQGTWRSFFAMMLVAPIVALNLPEDISIKYPNATQFEFIAVQILTYVIGWVAVPVAAFEIGRWLKRADDMPAYITVYNWFQLIHLPFAVATWAAMEGDLEVAASLLSLINLIAYFVYLFFLSRSFLRVEAYAAAIFVIADLAISLALGEIQELALLY